MEFNPKSWETTKHKSNLNFFDIVHVTQYSLSIKSDMHYFIFGPIF
jgi:hypothetical protein